MLAFRLWHWVICGREEHHGNTIGFFLWFFFGNLGNMKTFVSWNHAAPHSFAMAKDSLLWRFGIFGYCLGGSWLSGGLQWSSWNPWQWERTRNYLARWCFAWDADPGLVRHFVLGDFCSMDLHFDLTRFQKPLQWQILNSKSMLSLFILFILVLLSEFVDLPYHDLSICPVLSPFFWILFSLWIAPLDYFRNLRILGRPRGRAGASLSGLSTVHLALYGEHKSSCRCLGLQLSSRFWWLSGDWCNGLWEDRPFPSGLCRWPSRLHSFHSSSTQAHPDAGLPQRMIEWRPCGASSQARRIM